MFSKVGITKTIMMPMTATAMHMTPMGYVSALLTWRLSFAFFSM